MTHDTWFLVCDTLATYRLAVLLTEDKITAWLREGLHAAGYFPDTMDRVIMHKRPGPLAAAARWLHELVICPWCVGIWLAAMVTAMTALIPGVWQYGALALAASGVAGFLGERTNH